MFSISWSISLITLSIFPHQQKIILIIIHHNLLKLLHPNRISRGFSGIVVANDENAFLCSRIFCFCCSLGDRRCWVHSVPYSNWYWEPHILQESDTFLSGGRSQSIFNNPPHNSSRSPLNLAINKSNIWHNFSWLLLSAKVSSKIGSHIHRFNSVNFLL